MQCGLLRRRCRSGQLNGLNFAGIDFLPAMKDHREDGQNDLRQGADGVAEDFPRKAESDAPAEKESFSF
jgi:hypothetical protein